MKIAIFSRLSLGQKLFLASLVLLVIPWTGSRYIQDMENYLRHNQETLLLDRAQIIAAVLQSQTDLFASQPVEVPANNHHLYVRSLPATIQLDGYDEDWLSYGQHAELFDDRNLVYRSDSYHPASLTMQQQVGRYGRFLFALFRIRDRHIVYRNPNSNRLDNNDHLEIAMYDSNGNFRRYQIATIAPGWINAHLVDNNSAQPIKPESQIKGEWQETSEGLTIEIRIPLNMIGSRLSFTYNDVDDRKERQVNAIIGATPTASARDVGTLTIPSPQLENLLQPLAKPASRIWVIDRYNRVLGIGNKFNRNDEEAQSRPVQADLLTGLVRLFYSMVLEQPTATFEDDLSSASRLDSIEFRSALEGEPMTRWRTTPDKRASILTAVHPVIINGKVSGAIAIEETSQQILLMQNRAMEVLLNLSLLALFMAFLVLVFFASRLSYRIRRLRNQADNAITQDGRVQGDISHTDSRDEIGDLSRGISSMLHRLSQYNRYLETLASKLSHELRTPVTVVRSSIENLEQSSNLSDEAQQYTERAREGIERLHNILTRMSEATRLEQTLQAEEIRSFDILKVISGCVEGYRIAHPESVYQLHNSAVQHSLFINGAPELIAQMLDKLADNAREFAVPGTPVIFSIHADQQHIVVGVANSGKLLPDSMQNQLFDSMVSVRDKRGPQPHLGLGLYIVRLIAEYHQAEISAANLADQSGVIFRIKFPRAEKIL